MKREGEGVTVTVTADAAGRWALHATATIVACRGGPCGRAHSRPAVAGAVSGSQEPVAQSVEQRTFNP